jgi:hypothetical protein
MDGYESKRKLEGAILSCFFQERVPYDLGASSLVNLQKSRYYTCMHFD